MASEREEVKIDDAMVRRGARALFERVKERDETWDGVDMISRVSAMVLARDVLEAALNTTEEKKDG